MKKLSLLLLLPLLGLIACKENKASKQSFLRNTSITSGIDSAKAQQKGLILISNKEGCSMCELFEVDLMKDEAYAEKVYSNFVLQRIDENSMGNRWLARLLNRGSFPIFLFFNNNMSLIGIEMGAINKKEMETYIANTLKGEKWVDKHYQPGAETNMPASKLLSYVENSYKAQLYWTQFRTKQKENFDKIEPALKTSIAAYPTFFNNHLLARYYTVKKDTIQSRKSATLALSFNDPTSLYFNANLRTELKYIVNPNYDIYSEPYIAIGETEQQLGQVKFGEKRTVSFKITNLGRETLLFKKPYTSCNCTLASYPEKGIKPKETGVLTVNFSATKSGEFTQIIYVTTNAINSPLELAIKGVVLGN
ncbi:MAG: DUF1573 domain-containing protein [Pedobacter sp.]|uniref:DUF1573 domain-containing protein n=1 Tax=Pedobacter sp. TaxID=1411316 RepID=UPI002807CCC1|nr:DUF1573 domain-containing protein [Pedobacter sp.]MDQ8005181.1 DUF1573 domain-containing protein [Pedobacter sp.]